MKEVITKACEYIKPFHERVLYGRSHDETPVVFDYIDVSEKDEISMEDISTTSSKYKEVYQAGYYDPGTISVCKDFASEDEIVIIIIKLVEFINICRIVS